MNKCLMPLLLLMAGHQLVAEEKIGGGADVHGNERGLVVHLYCGDGRRTAALHEGRFVVHGLDADVTDARRHIHALGLDGKVSVAPWSGGRLPYVDNLVNRIVADDLGTLPMDEVLRVLAPDGVAWIGGIKTVKPRPEGIDEWPQHYHGPDNNAVARDRVVGPPRHFQWISDPVWSRSHLGMPSITSLISAKGRLFTIEDHGSVENPALPGRYTLVCRDAFNGIELWRHPFPDWHPVNIFVKLTPSQLQRQLVAVDDRIYCTPGLHAPITVFDAATGKILGRYEGTERTQEFVCDDGVLFVVVGDPVDTSSVGGGAFTLKDSAFPADAYSPRIEHRDDPESSIVAIDSASGRTLWKKQGDAMRSYQGTSLAVRGGNLAYATLDFVACLDRDNGRERWRAALGKQAARGDAYRGSGRGAVAAKKNKRTPYTHPHARRNTVKLVLSDEAVYLAEVNTLTVFAIKDGAALWTAKTRMNHHKTPDVLLTGGVVWTANKQAYEPLTGKPIRTLPQKMTGPMGHDRCYENRITERWYINTVTGGSDFLALDGSGEYPSPWGRSTCGIGHLPCNGLLYLGPPACSCGNKVQLISLNALSAEPGLESSGQPLDIPVNPQLEKGPAFDDVIAAADVAESDWPAYRHDATRGGCTRAAVGETINPLWQTKLGARASAPVIVGDRVYVADVDAHAVCALSAVDGKVQWRYTAGGRVDTPPTWHAGRLLFGSHDGWVYCLRAKDGALMWRFKALPDRLICAYGQVESAWPVCGSILVRDDIAYCVAGRNSYVDGGLFLFALDPKTGRILHQRNLYGPYDKNGHPVISRITALGGTGAGGVEGNKGDILSARGGYLFLRHQAFKKDLAAPGPDEPIRPHIIATHGYAEATPHHRSFWTIDTELYYDRWTATLGVRGDILVMDGDRYYEVRGYPPGRYTTYDVRTHAYTLFAGALSKEPPRKAHVRDHKEVWKTRIPLTGKAMVLAGDVLFVAGTPAVFPENDLARAYEGRMGGVLWAASVADGRKLAEYKLDAAPAWDSLAATRGRLFLCTADGRVHCFAGQGEGGR